MAKFKGPTTGDILGGAGQGAGIGMSVGGPVGAAVGGIIGGIGSALFGGRDESPEEIAIREYLDKIRGIKGIDYAASIPILEAYKAGKITDPNLLAEIGPMVSAMEGIKETNPDVAASQMQALGELRRRSGGQLTLEDISNLRKIQQEQAAQVRGDKQAILQKQAAQGTSTGGAGIALQAASIQGAANQAAASGLDIAARREALAQKSSLDAGQLASSLREQQFGEEATKAKSADAMNQFRTNLSTRVQSENVAALNRANEARDAERRAAELSRLNVKNLTAERRAAIDRQRYNDEMTRAGIEVDARTGMARAGSAADSASAKASSDIFSGLAGVATAGADKGYWGTPSVKPKGVSPLTIIFGNNKKDKDEKDAYENPVHIGKTDPGY